MDCGEKVISGLMEGEALDDKKRGGERRIFFIELREMWQENAYKPLGLS